MYLNLILKVCFQYNHCIKIFYFHFFLSRELRSIPILSIQFTTISILCVTIISFKKWVILTFVAYLEYFLRFLRLVQIRTPKTFSPADSNYKISQVTILLVMISQWKPFPFPSLSCPLARGLTLRIAQVPLPVCQSFQPSERHQQIKVWENHEVGLGTQSFRRRYDCSFQALSLP